MPAWEIVLIVFGCTLGVLFLSSISCFVLTLVRLFEINFLVPFEFKLSGYRDDREKMLKDFEWFESQIFEEYEIKSYDKKRLKGYLLRNSGQKFMICFHGYRASAKNDFSSSAQFYYKLGYNVLFVNQRSHGKSCGRLITFGVREKYDVKSWCEFVSEKLEAKEIVLSGVSMGASTILMAQQLDLSKKVKAVIADCGYTCPADIIKQTIKTIHLPVYPTFWFINFYSILFSGINLKKYNTISAVEKSKTPTLFIHGTADKFVPPRMSVENYEHKIGKKKLIFIEGAYHAGAHVKNPELYEKEVKDFLEKNLC